MKEQDVKKVSKTNRKENRKKEVKRQSLVAGILISIIIVLTACISLKPILKNLNFGLDLQGGFEILYEVKSSDGKKVTKEMVKNTYTVIDKRINVLGVSEPEISIEGNNIRVQLAGVTDEEEAKATISKMANLTFRNSKDELVMDSSVLKSGSVKVVENPNEIGSYMLSIEIANVDLFHEKTEVIRKNNDVLVIWLDFEEGVDTFEKNQAICGTGNNSRCISYARVSEELTTDSVQLTGNFTKEEAKKLAELINSGSLPTKLEEISSQSVDATFGKDTLEKTFIAGLIGIIAIMLILIAIYRFSGLITSISILAYTILVFLIFSLVGGRLTLPGIAAVVIGIGMAVDASSISFSSIKNEIKKGKTLKEAFKDGNKNSLIAIIDANITTLIAAIVLYIFGVSSVKGFATMLIISIFVTIIIMVYLNRYILNCFVESEIFEQKEGLFIGVRKNSKLPKFNFVKCRLVTLIIIPLIIVVTGLISFNTKGLNLSIDFKGGTNIVLSSAEKLNVANIKADINELGYKYQDIKKIDDKTVNVRIKETFKTADNEKVEKYFANKYKEASTNIGSISNEVKKDLIANAIKSVIYACVCILIYVAIRFKFNYAISTIFALLHDCLVIFVIFSLFNFEISSVFIAAILSIIGYSINDTIIIFDTIRAAIKKRGKKEIKNKEELAELVNDSLSSVIGRCVVTSLTTLIPVIALLVFGSSEIVNFNAALLIGIMAGTYSSLFMAALIWYSLEKRSIGKPKKKKWYEDDKKEVEELKVKGINC